MQTRAECRLSSFRALTIAVDSLGTVCTTFTSTLREVDRKTSVRIDGAAVLSVVCWRILVQLGVAGCIMSDRHAVALTSLVAFTADADGASSTCSLEITSVASVLSLISILVVKTLCAATSLLFLVFVAVVEELVDETLQER